MTELAALPTTALSDDQLAVVAKKYDPDDYVGTSAHGGRFQPIYRNRHHAVYALR